ncbi:MAG: RluA family pseudouridine synthase [Huintestinicola sp.]
MIIKLKQTENGITRNGILCKTTDRLLRGDTIVLTLPADEKAQDANHLLSVPKVYEDEDIVIYNKPSGMPVHPSAKHRQDTLGNCFAAEYGGLAFRPVNRLDKDTSGLCLIAKNPLAANISSESISKVYYAAVSGRIAESGRIDAPIARERKSIIKRVVRSDGKHAVTNYTPLRSNGKYTLLEITLETGRTHQIRVHMAHIGHPLAGDDLYGGSREDISRQALHCGRMTLTHPVTGETITASAPLPEDMCTLI